jgi:hypothetical protein
LSLACAGLVKDEVQGDQEGDLHVASRSEDAMDLSTKLKITAVMAAVWAVPVPV